MSEERNTKERIALWSLVVAVVSAIVAILAYVNDLEFWPGGSQPPPSASSAPGVPPSALTPAGGAVSSSPASVTASSSPATLMAEPARGGPGVTVTFAGGQFASSEIVDVSLEVRAAVDVPDGWPRYHLYGQSFMASSVTAEGDGSIAVRYTVLSGQDLRNLEAALQQSPLPITVTVTARGNTTNREAAGMYVVDSESS